MNNSNGDGAGSASARQPLRRLMLRTMVLPLLGGALVFAARPVGALPCWAVFLLAALLAWPIWVQRTEYRLFQRRLLVEGVIQPGSRLRPLLWKGVLVKAVQTLAALLLAWLLLVLVSQLSAEHGYALVLDAVLLALVIYPVTRSLAASVAARHRDMVARHWPLLLLNTAVLTGGIMWLDFAIVGSADTRQLAWHQVAVQAFSAVNDTAGCVLWGVSGGVLAAVEALSWHVSTLVIPRLPDVPAQLAGWVFFLLRGATLAYLFTTLLLGSDIIIQQRLQRAGNNAGGGTFSRAFLLTILVLAAVFYYASAKLEDSYSALSARGGEGMPPQTDPCLPDPMVRTRLQAQLDTDIAATRLHARREAEAHINQGLETIFSAISAGVDDYLDWYFSVSGEYQRLATAFTGDAAAAMREQLQQRLFAGIELDRRLAALSRSSLQQSVQRFAYLAPALADTLETAPCGSGPVNPMPFRGLDRDSFRASIAATSGIGAGIMTSKALASKTAAAVAGKIAAKTSLKGGTALASKMLAKKGSSSLLSAGAGTVLCAPTGPFAILCGISAGAMTWLSVDKLLVEADEAFNREVMRSDILQVLADQRAVLAGQLIEQHYTRIDVMAARLDTAMQRSFVPYSDGIDHP